MIDGVGYDWYPRGWGRIESLANLEDYNTCCLGESVILYARSEEDRKKFEGYREKLFENLKNSGFVFGKALEKLKVAMEIYQTMMFSEEIGDVRMSAGFIADYLAVAVANMNGTYFKYSQVNQLEELEGLKEVPNLFVEYYRSIIRADSIDELKKLCHLLVLTTRKFLEARKIVSDVQKNADFEDLAGW